MPMTSSARSSQRNTAGRGGGVAWGGSGPQPSLGVSVTGRQVPIAGTHLQILETGRANVDLHAPEAPVLRGIGGDVADAVSAADVFCDRLEGLDDFFFRV